MAELEPDLLRDRRLLVVEDDYAIASDLEEALEAHGAQVIGPAGTVADALELIAAQGEIHGAVLDIDLHGERAYPVADALRARGVPFVFATGYDAWIIPDAYAEVPRCEKPVDTRAVARMLMRRRAKTDKHPVE